jgi:hypothetical protein
MKNLFLAVFVFLATPLFSQCVAPFQDINNFVYLFDAGQSNYIENLPISSIKVGRSGIAAYVPQNGRLKVYYKGKTYNVNDNAPNYYMTDNWMLYQNYNIIKVFYNNEFKTLENFFREGIDSLYYSDSLILWNNVLGELNVFYNGETKLLERTEIMRGKAGDNIFAYIERNGNFKVFYHGELQTLETYEPRNFVVDRDMVLYEDWYGNLKFFQDGVVRETTIPVPTATFKLTKSNLTPIVEVDRYTNYVTGEGFAAYISQLRQLVVFYKGEETILMNDRPEDVTVKENIVAYTDKGKNFWCWYKGKKYWLERYLPLSYQVDNDIIVYQDLDYRLKAFYFGEQVQVSDQMVKKDQGATREKYQLWNEAVTYSIMPYQTKVWCNKKTYTFE